MQSVYATRPMIDLSRVPPVPRLVHRRASLGFFIGPARLGTALLVCLAVAWGAMLIWYALIAAYGTDVPAQITGHGSMRGRGSSHRDYIDYQYADARGWHSASGNLLPGELAALFDGMPFTVRTLNVGPLSGSLIPRDPLPLMLANASFLFNGAVLLAAALSLAWKFYIRPFRYRHLLRDGAAAVGKITDRTAKIVDDRSRSWWRSNDPDDDPYGERPTRYTLRYQFTLPNGKQRTSSMNVGLGDFGEVQCGEEVLVFYDPQRPRYSVIYPFEDDVIAGMEPPDEQLEAA